MTSHVMEQAASPRAKENANPENELNLLEAIEAMPETTQADLATQVGEITHHAGAAFSDILFDQVDLG